MLKICLRGKIIIFLEIILFYYLKLNIKQKHGKGLEILTLKQMLQRSPIALAEVKAGTVSENFKWNR